MSETKIPGKTKENLAKYLTAIGAITAVSSANSQIIYTDVNPDITLNMIADSTQYGQVDVNNDGIDDFVFGLVDYMYSSTSYNIEVYGAFIQPQSGNSWVGATSMVGTSTTYVPAALNTGAAISSGAAWQSSYLGALKLRWSYSSSGSTGVFNGGKWNNVVGRYLGVKFQAAGNTYYGWIRLNVGLDGKSIVLRDYAYRANPDTPINAGQLPTSLSENNAELANINSALNGITISLLEGNEAKFELTDLTGKVVHSEGLTQQVSQLQLDIATGVYVARVVQEEKMYTKKVYLR